MIKFDLLSKYEGPGDLKNRDPLYYKRLCAEVRWAIISRCAAVGGHLASNLGVVELTVAGFASGLMDPDNAVTVFDGAHAKYVYELLTGHKDWFVDPKSYHERVGLQDVIDFGHMGFGVSSVEGVVKAQGRRPVVVLSDAALGNGVAFQGLDLLSASGLDPVIILNDNGVGTVDNIGAVHEHLRRLREAKGNLADNFFRCLGYEYRFVGDGHDVASLVTAFSDPPSCPVVYHVVTQKGHGFAQAVKHFTEWHYVEPFNVKDFNRETVTRWDDGHLLVDALTSRVGALDERVYAVHVGMPDGGVGTKCIASLGDRCLQVGVAEEYAATTAIALAVNGKRVVLGTYSTFFQRMVDAFLNVAELNLVTGTLVVVLNEANVNDCNYPQQGVYDASLVKGLTARIASPKSLDELEAVVTRCLTEDIGLVFVRVPLGLPAHGKLTVNDVRNSDGFVTVRPGSSKRVVVVWGTVLEPLGDAVAERLGATVVNPLWSALDEQFLVAAVKNGLETVVTLEDSWVKGGFGESVAAFLSKYGVRVFNFGVSRLDYSTFRPCTIPEILKENGLTEEVILAKLTEYGVPV